MWACADSFQQGSAIHEPCTGMRGRAANDCPPRRGAFRKGKGDSLFLSAEKKGEIPLKGINTEDFVDQLMDTDGCVRHKSFVYHFSGLRWNPGRRTYRVSVEKYRFTKDPFEEFLELVYTYESDDAEDCMDHLLDDVLWDGKSFYDLEKALTYIEW